MKRFLLLPAALLLLLGANGQTVYKVYLEGECCPGVYTAGELARAKKAALAAAEELCDGEELLPALELRPRFTLRGTSGEVGALSHRLLIHRGAVEQRYAVSVNGWPLGTVSSREETAETLSRWLQNTMPTGAVAARLGGEVCYEPCYCPAGNYVTSPEDMVLLLSGKVPALFSDGQGNLIPG